MDFYRVPRLPLPTMWGIRANYMCMGTMEPPHVGLDVQTQISTFV